MQFDADTVGSAAMAADAEMCMMAADTMEALGIPRGSYVVKVNNRKVLDGLMETVGLVGEENAGRRVTVLRAIDKLDRFSLDEVCKLLGPGRWDGGEQGKGDFTKGAGLDDIGISRIINFTGWGEVGSGAQGQFLNNAVTIANFESRIEDNALGQAGVSELSQISELVAAAGYDDGRILIDPSVVRGLEYYTCPVYEVELLLDAKDEEGRTVRFGSV